MDIKLKKRPWYVRYRGYLAGAAVVLGLMVYAAVEMAGPSRRVIRVEEQQVAEVMRQDFLEFLDVDGTVQPISTIRVNAREGGTVRRIVAQDGQQVHEGDTLLVLSNPNLEAEVQEQQMKYEQQCLGYRRQLLEMEQKGITLRQQALQTRYEMQRLEKSFALEEDEARMGVKSKAQLEVARDEYEFHRQKTALAMESLRHDSLLNLMQHQLVEQQMAAEQRQMERQRRRLGELVVLSPAEGQLSGLGATLGQQLAAGETVGVLSVLTSFKTTARLNEYYVDRITTGLRATTMHRGHTYELRVGRVLPQVQDHSFSVELIFQGELPPDLRVGRSLRLKLELGQPEQALIVPRGNFFQHTGGQWIFRIDPQDERRATRVPVVLGRQNPLQYEVIDGLREGDRVIISGYDKFGEVEELRLD
ncbi:MAG: efflux RND transporter periplasmic adaptor subunit [Bacteroidaceae bacterium]|nr:efflux RND transporter periplasmic adaptor subunit [Bacteroidaceae bacterium]